VDARAVEPFVDQEGDLRVPPAAGRRLSPADEVRSQKSEV